MIDLTPWLDAVPAAVVERLTAARRVLAVGHENPDADTVGATLAVCRLVERNGATATAVFADPVPPLYDFLADVARARTEPDPAIDYDLLVVSDCASLERIGSVVTRHPELFERLPRVVIDHHASNGATGATDWIDPHSAATCEMVTLLAARLGAPLDLDHGALATDLMAGIVMDTATFAHPNATPRTLAVSGALVHAGAPLSEISRRLYRTKPATQLKLFGRVLERLETAAGGRIIHSTLLDADLAATDSTPPESEGIIDLLAQSENAEVAILFKESGEGTRISVRTKPGGVDATVLTGTFGGGGHARASGATLLEPVDRARPQVIAEAERLLAAVVR
jgi:bifunctional oligoribonuclease and PAP phosphatase NrnA